MTALFLFLGTGLNSVSCPVQDSRNKFLLCSETVLITSMKKNSNWAGSVKDCLEAYGFQDVWTNGRVDNEKDFLSSFKQRMMERFKQERNAKLFDSDKIFYLRLI